MVPSGPELVDVEFPLYHKYQVSNHHDEPAKVSFAVVFYTPGLVGLPTSNDKQQKEKSAPVGVTGASGAEAAPGCGQRT